MLYESVGYMYTFLFHKQASESRVSMQEISAVCTVIIGLIVVWVVHGTTPLGARASGRLRCHPSLITAYGARASTLRWRDRRAENGWRLKGRNLLYPKGGAVPR